MSTESVGVGFTDVVLPVPTVCKPTVAAAVTPVLPRPTVAEG